MGMVVRTNMAAINANNSLQQASKAQQNGMQKLASGFKINKAADDASGLAISEKMKNQIKALDTAKDNCEDGANMIQTAEGYMSETHDILNRMTELAEKSANGTLGKDDRDALQDEMNELCGEIDRIATTANFNGHKLLDGSIGGKEKITLSCDEKEKTIKYNGPTIENDNKSISAGNNYNVDGSNLKPGTYTFDGTDWKDGNGKAVTVNSSIKAGTSVTFGADASNKVNVGGAVVKGNTTAADADLKNKTITLKEDGKWYNADDKDVTDKLDVEGKVTTGTSISIGADATAENIVGGIDITGTNDAAVNGKTVTVDEEGKWFDEDGNDVTDKVTVDMTSAAFEGDSFTVKEGINLQIGESSTSADRLEVKINSFHTDTLFAGLNGFVNTTNDSDNKAATSAVKINGVTGTAVDGDLTVAADGSGNTSSTYKNAVSIDITDKDAASAAADAIRQISNYVSDERGKLGAQQNRLDHTVNNLTTASENTSAANSRIRDTDMAKEMMAYTSKNVIAQAAQSMLAQANSQPQNVLSLLQ